MRMMMMMSSAFERRSRFPSYHYGFVAVPLLLLSIASFCIGLPVIFLARFVCLSYPSSPSSFLSPSLFIISIVASPLLSQPGISFRIHPPSFLSSSPHLPRSFPWSDSSPGALRCLTRSSLRSLSISSSSTASFSLPRLERRSVVLHTPLTPSSLHCLETDLALSQRKLTPHLPSFLPPRSASVTRRPLSFISQRRTPLFADSSSSLSPTNEAPHTSMVTVSPKAMARIQELWKQKMEKTTTVDEGDNGKDTPSSPTPFIIRLGVQSGGCSGLSYVLNIIDQKDVEMTDHQEKFFFADNSGKGRDGGEFLIVIDPKSLLYVIGTELDYSDDLIGGGFRVINPNASRSCSCGMSFGVPKNFRAAKGEENLLIESTPKRCGTGVSSSSSSQKSITRNP